MKNKALICIALIFAAGTACLTACKKSEPVPEKRVTMEVHAHYSGYGVTGQDLGSGTNIYEIKGLTEGDMICEGFGELKPAKDPSNFSGDPLLQIESINDDGVVVLVTQGDYSMGYDRGKYGFNMLYGVGSHFDTLHYIYDGLNYTYYVTFTRET